MASSLSGRLLLLTIVFVMVSMALVYIPTVSRYHQQLLAERVALAELAILPFTEAPGAQLSGALRMQLLGRAGVRAVVLTGGGQHELYPVGEDPPRIDAVYHAGGTGIVEQLRDVLRTLTSPPDRIIRIDSATEVAPGPRIFVIADEAPIRDELLRFSLGALALGIVIAALTSILVFMTLYRLFVRPMKRMIDAMIVFRNNPEDSSRILEPSLRLDEIGTAERELSTMQRDIYEFLQQKTRLAQLGNAVTKIQHELRNILSTAQLASERIASSTDPAVKSVMPRLVDALDRAAALASNTLRYGRAEEPPPDRSRFPLAPLIDNVAAAALADARDISVENKVARDLEIDADPDQLFRVLFNLMKNAREALDLVKDESLREGRHLVLEADRRDGITVLNISDNGPGISPHLRERLFQPFASARRGGTGLGLAIARELVRAHGGDLILADTSPAGTRFRLSIPDRGVAGGAAVLTPTPFLKVATDRRGRGS
jgi:signal transduction histidine kinase